MAPRRPNWAPRRSWPRPGTRARRELDDLYWGDPALDYTVLGRPEGPGWYFRPIIESPHISAPLAGLSDSHGAAEAVLFAAIWRRWRRRMGTSPEKRRQRRQYKRRANDYDFEALSWDEPEVPVPRIAIRVRPNPS